MDRYQTGTADTVVHARMSLGVCVLCVRYYDRFPVDSASSFKLLDQEQIENAEGVIASISVQAQRRSSRRGPAANQRIISIDAEQIQRQGDIPSLDAMCVCTV